MDADELYALPPEQFTAARDAAATAARADDPAAARHLKALRKPSVAAWLVNLLAAHEGELLDQLLELGPLLAQAQAGGQGDELRSLGAQRRELVEAVTARAVALAGRDVTAAVRQEVSATLDTALADPGAAEAVRSGRLVRPLSYAGFGGVDLEGAVAVQRPVTAARPDRVADAAALEAAALEASGHLDDAVRACERREQERADAERREEQADQAVEQARQRLQQAEEQAGAARTARETAERAAAEAVTAVRDAQEAAEQARTALDRSRRTG